MHEIHPPDIPMPNMSDNSTNNTIMDQDTNFMITEISSLVALCVSIIILDLPCFITIYECRLKLVVVELYILLVNSLAILAFKLLNISLTIQSIFKIDNHSGITPCLIYYLLSGYLFWCYLSTLFYYSLFHLSTLKSASRLFKKLSDLVQSTRVFFIYCSTFSIAFGFAITFYSVFLRNRLFHTTSNGCDSSVSDFELLGPLMALNIAFLTVLVYLVAIISLVIWRIRNIGKKKRSKEKMFRKTLIMFIKFFIFSCLACILTVSQNYLVSISFFFSSIQFMLVVKILGALFMLLIVFNPLFLIYAHNILKDKFKYRFCW